VEMRPAGRIFSSCIRISLYQGFVGVHERKCALFHACDAVSATVLRRDRMFRSVVSRRGAERQSRGAFGRAR